MDENTLATGNQAAAVSGQPGDKATTQADTSQANNSQADTSQANTQAKQAGQVLNQGQPADNSQNSQRQAGQQADKPATQNSQPADSGQADKGVAAAWQALSKELPEGADADLCASFVSTAQSQGLSPEQAQGLMQWQLKAIADARAKMVAQGKAELVAAWGEKAETNRQQVLSLISQVDRKLGDDSFSKAIGSSGAACHAAFVRGLHELAKLTAEDSLGAQTTTTPMQKTETPLEALQNIFGK